MKYLGLGVLAATALLGGCASSLVNIADGQATPTRGQVRSHMVAGTLGGNGKINRVTDRTSKGVRTDTTVNTFRGAPTSVAFSFRDEMDRGTDIPATGRMRVSEAVARKLLNGETIRDSDLSYQNEDAFLQIVGSGDGYVAGRLENKVGQTGFLGYIVAGETTKRGNIPTRGTATYNGKAVATVFGSRSGQQKMTANTELAVDFARGARTVEGKLTNVRVAGRGQDLEFQLRQAKISGNTYSGRIDLTGRGDTDNGVVRTSSIFSGAFYGRRAEGTAGTFHFRGTNVRLLDRRQQIEVVGTFGGDR